MADAPPWFRDALLRAIRNAQGIWFYPPVRRYFDRTDTVRLGADQAGEPGEIVGTCCHDLALTLAVGLWSSIQTRMPAHEYVLAMRIRTSAESDLGQLLAGLAPQVGSECQRAIRQRREEEGQGDGAHLIERACAKLAPNQDRIWRHLCRVGTAGYDALRAVPRAWRDSPSDEAIEKQLKRIRRRLEEASIWAWRITISPGKRTVTVEPAD